MADGRLSIKSSLPRIGIDLMGSDAPPELLFQGVLDLVEHSQDADFVVFLTQEVLGEISCPLETVIVTDVITMDDDPISSVRRKKDSSICKGMRLLKEGALDAFVSAGNTGALLVAGKTILKTLPGIDRPALLALIPTKKREMALLDVGANASIKENHILQFAAMGIAFQKSRGIENPTVGLLNIGTEVKKGKPELREMYQKLEALNRDQITFVGNIEGRDAFLGDIDVLVTDGFSGNVFLKTGEGVAAFILEELEQAGTESMPPHFKTILSKLQKRLHHAEYPGAILCGVEGIVVKCHGDSTPESLMSGVKGAIRLVKHSFLDKIRSQLTAS